MNRLGKETSPYLIQHAENPVEWYAWGQEAFDRAKAEDRPIFLSIGYSACHWCHVMAHESFENEATAKVMNDLYINIKVDREERPDVDDIYMTAVQALTGGHGGWPLSVFLLPDGRPFYGGTYYPPEARYGMPSFMQVLEGVNDAFTNRRAEVEAAAGGLTDSLQRTSLGIGSQSALNTGLLDAAQRRLTQQFDLVNGGLAGAPKFPQPMTLEFLLRYAVAKDDQDTLDFVIFTLKQMANGGIYDQIGGGFHRYSVDAVWLVPHFEKMLYDNALLSRLYLHTWQVTRDPFFKKIALEIYDYILREMTAPEGGFYSATDADSEGEEGKFFVWSKAELETLLGENAPLAIAYYGVTERGNFEGHNILHVAQEDAVVADRLGIPLEQLQTRLIAIKDTLFAARTQRVNPGLDDKIITAWVGLMLASLAEAARVFDREDYRIGAERAGEFLFDTMLHDGDRLWRTAKDGHAHLNGVLEDYANLIEAFLELYQTTFDQRWFDVARRLADRVLSQFRADDGGFFDTSIDHEKLITRPRNLQDNAIPAGSSSMARGLSRLAAYTGDGLYDDAARATLAQLSAAMQEYPQAFGHALTALDGLVRGISEVAVIGDIEASTTQALLRAVFEPYYPNVITAHADEDVTDEHAIPLLSHRTQKAGQPTVYVCRNFACKLPVTEVSELQAQLKEI